MTPVRRLTVWLCLLLLYCISGPGAQAAARSVLNEVRVLDLDGNFVNPFVEPPTNKFTVIVFMAVDCPICNKYIPELNRLAADYKKPGVQFWFSFPDPDLNLDTLKKHCSDFALSGRILLDAKQELARVAHAQVTPEAAVFGPKGDLLYRGRIDDRFPSLGVERSPGEPTLKLALDNLLAGKKAGYKDKPAVGCQIPKAK